MRKRQTKQCLQIPEPVTAGRFTLMDREDLQAFFMEDKAMENSGQGVGTSLTYKIDGEVCSFESVDELLNHLKTKVESLKEPLTVEPINRDGHDYDHMQEIMDLTYQIGSCIKGLRAMAEYIQRSGNFIEYAPIDIIELGMQCMDILDKLRSIAEASEDVYESDWKANKAEAELRRH